MKHHIIYIPGLNDNHSFAQSRLINIFRCFGFIPHYFPLGWNKMEGFEVKLTRIEQMIKELGASKDHVSLIGVSAGASAAINAFSRSSSLTAVVCISGKLNHPETVGQNIHKKNPDFKKSLTYLPRSLMKLDSASRKKIMSIHPWRDQTVPVVDTVINGATAKTVPGWSHISGILFGILYGAPAIAKFLRSTETS